MRWLGSTVVRTVNADVRGKRRKILRSFMAKSIDDSFLLVTLFQRRRSVVFRLIFSLYRLLLVGDC